ncbi:MAG: UDP-N-acetylglucosamine 4,6-dehydratase family protein [Candidatus Margulisiibacteriota bacterium]
MKDYFSGKKILVTGGTGSIGSEIVRQVIKYEPSVIRVFSNDEDAQFNLSQKYGSKGKVRFLFGDIRDEERLKWAMDSIDIVFHAAALKHVPACEFDPFEAVKTNVIGTQNVIKEALFQNVGKVINISTDKAVNPINVMGATKLLAERITISSNNYKGLGRTAFACVRFGNVLASRGSVVPIFLDQIKRGGPVTVTDPNMTRFIMSIAQSVELILNAAVGSKGGEIFILKMPAVKVGVLAEAMIEMLAGRYGHDPKKIEIKEIGMRSGEKFHEELMTHIEMTNAVDDGKMYTILPGMLDKKSSSPSADYNSASAEQLNKSEIIKTLGDLLPA